VSRQATAASLDPARTADLVLAVDEVATNSLRHGGRGLWMVNQLCDLVQLRSFPDGAAVRVHVYLP
jgi:two-component sensor histidine kinase